jgi:hypothetical protein
VVDILQVLEGLAYVGFIAGAIFAVIELRSMRRDRELDFYMRFGEHWTSKDFEEAILKVRELPPEIEDPQEIENRCGVLALWTYIDYLDGIGQMARVKLLKREFVLDLAEWAGLWIKLEPWIMDRRQNGFPVCGVDFQWIVEEDQKWFIRNLSRAELDS